LIEAQRSMEREYSRLRQAETRHRLLFQVALEAVVVVDASNSKIVEANPAAAEILGDAERRLAGRSFRELFEGRSRRTLDALYSKLDAAGHAEEFPVHVLGAGRALRISASQFREGRSVYYMVRLLPVELDNASISEQRRKSRVFEFVESSPDGFVVTDMKGAIVYANRAFLDLVQLTSEPQALNEPLDRWLGRPGVDFSLLATQLREHQTLKLFSTSLRGEYGSTTDVEICAVAVPEGGDPYCGFSIRDVSNRLPVDRRVANTVGDRPRSVEQLTGLVGRVPLKQLVRESTDMIERLCIEAALELTGDNRASAAEILGLSRQGLYAKLHRHGIAEIGGSPAPNARN
ncbi:MAG TPA: transcriptional regulator PpsR, partial [Steroidobacteraceae bacterium]|nr:transcriptional regulator PpsR [Steroidobacteraceae bacterium]